MLAAAAAAAAAAAVAASYAFGATAGSTPPVGADGEEALALRKLRLAELRSRADAVGVGTAALDDAMECDNPKAAIAVMLLELEAGRAPAVGLLPTLASGGEGAAAALAAALDRAIAALESAAAASPRKGRKRLRDLLEAAEEMAEDIDGEWCDAAAACGTGEMQALCAAVLRLRPDSTSPADAVTAVDAMLRQLDRCGRAAVQALGVLSSGATGADECLRSLEVLRNLPELILDEPSQDELDALAIASELSQGRATQPPATASALMAVLTLSYRNCDAVLRTEKWHRFAADILEKTTEAMLEETSSQSAGRHDVRSACAGVGLMMLTLEVLFKVASDVRPRLIATVAPPLRAFIKHVQHGVTVELLPELTGPMLRGRFFSDEPVHIAIGATLMLHFFSVKVPDELEDNALRCDFPIKTTDFPIKNTIFC